MTRFQQNSFKSGLLQPRMQPLRQWPASNPIRFTAKPSASKKETRAAGSLEIASFTILPARPQRKRSTVPMTRRSLHSVPRLSSVSRMPGPTQRRDPVCHLSGDSHLQRSPLQGPLRHLVIARPGTNLAAEDPIRPSRISDDYRQQKKRADEEKRLRAGCGGRIPQTD